MTALLTIAIPTWNRASYLRHLLSTLHDQIGSNPDVHVIVSDNASTDATADVIAEFASVDWQLTALRNAENIGGDGNIIQVFEQATTRYVWLLGDDDVPCRRAVGAVLAMLKRDSPDLVGLRSLWVSDSRSVAASVADANAYDLLDAQSFAKRVNIWTTFVSGIIVNKELFSRVTSVGAVRLQAGTNLIQLGWVLPVLQSGTTFVQTREPWVVATGGNSGGYAVLTTFTQNLATATKSMLGDKSPLTHAILSRASVSYLPQLIWNIRFVDGGRFLPDVGKQVLQSSFGMFPAYWVFLVPLTYAPRPIAKIVLLAARATAALQRRFDEFQV